MIALNAGTLLRGVDILTSSDDNECGCTTFAGIILLSFSLIVHYPSVEGEERFSRNARLNTYFVDHHRTVLALDDGAFICVQDDSLDVV